MRTGVATAQRALAICKPFQTVLYIRTQRAKTGVFFTKNGRCGSRQLTRASAEEVPDQVPVGGMTEEFAMEILGVGKSASFEDIVSAKNKLVAANSDEEFQMTVDAAYDVLLMRSFNKRRSGEIVDRSVRYADVKRPKPTELPGWAKKAVSLPSSAVTFEKVRDEDFIKQGAIYAGLMLWTLAQGVSQPQGMNIPSTQLALAFGLSIYFLRENKRSNFGRAALLSTGGLIAGALVGGLLQSWLRVDIVPIGSLSSPEIIVGEGALLALWATCTFLA